jgi:serine phosphatase RsbU (regulator of sigma subunit)/predicted enzyme related to lactoylglutathione lyase
MASTSPSLPDQVLRVHCVKVYVRDQEKSLRFYLDQLGFRLMADTLLQSGERWLAVAPPDGDTVLALVSPEPASRQYALIGRPTDVVFVTNDVIARYREWSKCGVKFLSTPKLRRVRSAGGGPIAPGHESPVWGGVFAHFKDIDGNSFSLVSFDEVTEVIERRRRAEAERAEAERRIAQEIEIARQVQAHLFPQTLPALNTLEYAGRCHQARQVGGDYYDFLPTGPNRLSLIIGDISGKGIAAALLMANLQANLRSQCTNAIDNLGGLLGSVNRLFCENTPDNSYATFIFSEYDDRARRLRYANCGHLAGLVIRGDDRIDRLEPTATVLGLFDNWQCGIAETDIFAGDVVALYTDGVTEACDGDGREYGEERLLECLFRHRELPAEGLVSQVVEDVRRHCPHEQQDDITLVVAKCKDGKKQDQLGLPYDWSV